LPDILRQVTESDNVASVEISRFRTFANLKINTENLLRPNKPVYLGVYTKPYLDQIYYQFYLSTARSFNYRKDGELKLISVKQIPYVWSNELILKVRPWEKYDLFFQKSVFNSFCNIGFIGYGTIGSCAYTGAYYPRVAIGRIASGLPYFLEAITTWHLKNKGFVEISTSTAWHLKRPAFRNTQESKRPDDLRIRQLEKVNLPIDEPTSADNWLRGLGRGIKSSINNTRRLSSTTNTIPEAQQV
jgi:hypothetical protein